MFSEINQEINWDNYFSYNICRSARAPKVKICPKISVNIYELHMIISRSAMQMEIYY